MEIALPIVGMCLRLDAVESIDIDAMIEARGHE